MTSDTPKDEKGRNPFNDIPRIMRFSFSTTDSFAEVAEYISKRAGIVPCADMSASTGNLEDTERPPYRRRLDNVDRWPF